MSIAMVRNETRKHQDIKNILAVLSSAIICAGLLSIAFIYYYGPSGRYLAGNSLLDPHLIETISYRDEHPRTGKKVLFNFDQIEFSYFDPQKGQKKVRDIPLQNYQQFYHLIASEKSLEHVTNQIEDYFIKSRPTILTISMKTAEGSDSTVTKTFQVVQFVQEDYFRVQLHGSEQGEWAYFYQSGLYKNAMQIFTQTER